jgi:hypothetical protein
MAEFGLSPLSIVKDFNELGKVSLSLQPRSILAVLDKFGFQYSPEPFYGSVVKTDTQTAHRQTCTKPNYLLWILYRFQPVPAAAVRRLSAVARHSRTARRTSRWLSYTGFCRSVGLDIHAASPSSARTVQRLLGRWASLRDSEVRCRFLRYFSYQSLFWYKLHTKMFCLSFKVFSTYIKTLNLRCWLYMYYFQHNKFGIFLYSFSGKSKFLFHYHVITI